jgi:tetratricopeptide (TPR) repeat protein
MLEWVQPLLYAILCIGLVIMTGFILVAMVRGLQLQIIDFRFRRAMSAKSWAVALDIISRALKISPTSPLLYYERAKVYTELGQYEAAEADYTHGMRYSQGATAYAGRAAVRLALGRTKEALIDANHAIACSRLWWRGYYERGRVYAALGHPLVALDDFNQALELNRMPPPEILQARAEVSALLDKL